MKKKGLSIPSIATIVLTVLVLAGFGVLYVTFRSDANIPVRAMEMAGLITDVLRNEPADTRQKNMTVTRIATPVPVPVANQTPVVTMPPPSMEVSMTIAGTVAFESAIADQVYDKETKTADYQQILQSIAPYNRGDLRFAAVSQAMDAEGRNYNDTTVHHSAAAALRAAGFQVAVMDGNGVLSQGAQSAENTANALFQNGLVVCGVNAGHGGQMVMLEQNGVRIAVISYHEALNTKAHNTLQSAAGNGLLSADSMEELKQLITSARGQGCACVMVYLHWKDTNVQKVSDGMRSMARDITAAGADVIVGCGIKRLFPADWVITADENGVEKHSLVIYSAGSLLSESREGYDLAGALFHLRMKADGNSIVIEDVNYTPTYIWRQNIGGKQQYRVINSAMPPPDEMNEAQRQVMERCKNRTDESLAQTLVLKPEH